MFAIIDPETGFNAGSRLAAVMKKIATNFGLLEPSVKVVATADYVPVIGDKVISRTSATAQTLTIPLNATTAFDIGTKIDVIQGGAGALTIQGAGGVTVNKLAAKTLVVGGQGGRVTLTKTAANVWNANGDLT